MWFSTLLSCSGFIICSLLCIMYFYLNKIDDDDDDDDVDPYILASDVTGGVLNSTVVSRHCGNCDIGLNANTRWSSGDRVGLGTSWPQLMLSKNTWRQRRRPVTPEHYNRPAMNERSRGLCNSPVITCQVAIIHDVGGPRGVARGVAWPWAWSRNSASYLPQGAQYFLEFLAER